MSGDQVKIGAVLSYIALALSSVITLIYTPYMLRVLGQAEYGLFALVNSIIAYLFVLDFGFGTAIVRYTAKYRAEKNSENESALHGMFVVLYLVIGIIAFSVSLALIRNIESLFSASLNASEIRTAKTLMYIAAGNLALSFPFSVYSSIITAYERFKFAKAIHIVRLIINPVTMVIALSFGYRSIGMIAATTVVNLSYNVANLVYCKKYLHIRITFKRFDLPLLKEIGTYSFFSFLALVVNRLYWSSGQFLLGIYDGAAAVSIYAVGMQFVTLLYMNLSAAIGGLFLPRVTHICTSLTKNEELAVLFCRVGRIQLMILAMALTGFALYGRQFIALWAGDAYRAAYMVALINMVPLTVPLIQNIGVTILQARNMHAFRSVTYLATAVFNLLIAIPLIKVWGPIGAAVGTGVSLVLGHVVIMNIYYAVSIRLSIGLFWFEMAKLFPAALLPYGIGLMALKYIAADHLPGFVLHVSVYSALYCCCIYFIGMNPYEKELIFSPLRNFAARFYSMKRNPA